MSRDAILRAVRAHQGEPHPLPDSMPHASGDGRGLIERFSTVLEHVGGRSEWYRNGDDLAAIVRSHYPDARRVVSAAHEALESTVTVAADTAPADLATIELAILRGRLGVAENGAIWVDAEHLPHRALPFIAEHCVLLLDPDAIVPDMHAAYAALAGREYGWGAFVSGPSKTADIEQALVIGAQGPRSLLVALHRSDSQDGATPEVA